MSACLFFYKKNKSAYEFLRQNCEISRFCCQATGRGCNNNRNINLCCRDQVWVDVEKDAAAVAAE